MNVSYPKLILWGNAWFGDGNRRKGIPNNRAFQVAERIDDGPGYRLVTDNLPQEPDERGDLGPGPSNSPVVFEKACERMERIREYRRRNGTYRRPSDG